jgi:putative nucleotidyltransferase with HDIG domain
VVYLGHSAIKSLLLAASIATYLERPVPGYALERGELWKHSVGVAAGARLITLRLGGQVAEEAYSAGLLADIGKLALDSALRDADLRGFETAGASFADLERDFFGIDHATLGAEMARRWHLPEPLIEAIACHHRPAQAQAGNLLAAAVHVADGAMMMLGIGLGVDGLQYPLDPVACERLGWTVDKLPELIDKVVPLIEEATTFVNAGRK